jgi:hypothetical protein
MDQVLSVRSFGEEAMELWPFSSGLDEGHKQTFLVAGLQAADRMENPPESIYDSVVTTKGIAIALATRLGSAAWSQERRAIPSSSMNGLIFVFDGFLRLVSQGWRFGTLGLDGMLWRGWTANVGCMNYVCRPCGSQADAAATITNRAVWHRTWSGVVDPSTIADVQADLSAKLPDRTLD